MTRQELERSAVAQERAERALNDQAMILRLSARSMALGALVEHYAVKISSAGYESDRRALEERQLEYVDALEKTVQKHLE
jgi:hypothetical protein